MGRRERKVKGRGEKGEKVRRERKVKREAEKERGKGKEKTW